MISVVSAVIYGCCDLRHCLERIRSTAAGHHSHSANVYLPGYMNASRLEGHRTGGGTSPGTGYTATATVTRANAWQHLCSLRVLVSTVLVLFGGTATPCAAQATIRGSVFDSLITGAPLSGALVTLSGTVLSATTDRRGRFEIRDVPAGRYRVGFVHPELDSLGIGAPVPTIDIGAGGTVRLALATPSVETVSVRACGVRPESATSLLFGVVRSAEERLPLQGALARVAWFEFELPPDGRATERERDVTAIADSTGRYLLCSVPNDVALSLRVTIGTQSTGALELESNPRGISRRDITISLTDTAARSVAAPATHDTVPVVRPPGLAALRVIVRDEQARAVAGAAVGIRGTSASAITNADGVARLRALPSGSHTLVARAIGLAPAVRVVDLVPGEEVVMAVALPKVTTLALVSVVERTEVERTTNRAARAAEFNGYYLGREAMRYAGTQTFWVRVPRINPPSTPRNLPYSKQALDYSDPAFLTPQPTMRDAYNRPCAPTMLVDGRESRNLDGWELNSVLRTAVDVEVYTDLRRIPPAFLRNRVITCGLVVIWTR